MTIAMNLDQVEAWKPGSILPSGSHVCTVEEAAEGSQNDHPVIELKLRAIEGEHEGGVIRDWVHVTQASLGRVKQVLVACNYESAGDFNLDVTELVGSTVRILVREEPKQDGSGNRNVVKSYERATSANAGAAAPSNGFQPQGAGAQDDDIPF